MLFKTQGSVRRRMRVSVQFLLFYLEEFQNENELNIYKTLNGFLINSIKYADMIKTSKYITGM